MGREKVLCIKLTGKYVIRTLVSLNNIEFDLVPHVLRNSACMSST